MSVITLKQKKDLLSAVFGECSMSSNGKDIAVFCPVCKKSPKTKKKKKLSIVVETGVYHCWVCESKGKNIARFVRINFGLDFTVLLKVDPSLRILGDGITL